MLWAVIMAGGQGERLWPASRRSCPKQCIKLFGGKALIELTVSRVSKIVPPNRILILTDSKQQGNIRRLFPKIPPHHIVGEPAGRNTAATIALGTALILKEDPDAVVSVFPSDHAIFNHSGFKRSILRAFQCARRKKSVVVLGVKPTYPATAYGYLEVRRGKSSGGALKIKRFVEKPHAAKARRFFRSSTHYWHAGILVAYGAALQVAFRRYLPAHHKTAVKLAFAWKKKSSTFPLPHLFKRLPSISIDYGLLEKLKDVWMVRAGFDWNDVGSWNALAAVWKKDASGNAASGHVVGCFAEDNIVHAPKKLTALVGVRDLVVVDTPDALLVASKEHAEAVKTLVGALKKKKLVRYL